MNITWELLPCDNLRLCRFMTNYELRQQDYLVAFDGDVVLGAGLLKDDGSDAHVDVVVAPEYRKQGIGKVIVSRLIESAKSQRVERLTSHGDFAFWQALGFEKIADNQYCKLLPAAAQGLVETWHQGIPVTEFLGLTITHSSSTRVETSADMEKSINVHQSMFAGAIYSQAVLTGWGLIHLRAQQAGINGSIVLASGDIKYRKPITESPRGVVNASLPLSDFMVINDGDKYRVELTVNMHQGESDEASAQFIGRYVILPKS
ncbi:MAG: YiiD C-terminal domain-containing protein [Psychrobium sp.]